MFLNLNQKVSNASVGYILRRTIDLSGQQGNAYYLMGLVSEYAYALKLSKTDILKRMMSGDYDNLVAEFDAAFGELFYLVVPEDMDIKALEIKSAKIRKEVYNVQN